MTEFAIPLDQLMGMEPSLNGHADAAEPEGPRAHVDPKRGVFINSRGEELELSGKPITGLMLERVANQGKPSIPKVEVLLLGKHRQLESNPNDPNYQAALAEWETESRLRTLKYIFTLGVKAQPPQDFIDEQNAFFPAMNDLEMKYLYVASLIPDDDIDAFTEAVMGRTMPTAKGMDEVADSFRSDSQRESD